MSWYKKYLSIYQKPVSEVSPEIIGEIKLKIRQKQSDTPLASIIAIAHNEEERILACLWSLSENRTSFPIEIIVVNNQSTDKTEQVLEQVGARWLNETKKGPGHARQCGLDLAKGKYYVCIDSDSLYPPDYIETMVRALQKEKTAGVYALWSFIPDRAHSKTGLFFYETLRDIHLKIQNINRPELCVRGMAFAFPTEYGKKVGFRTDIIRGEDGSLALGLKEYGKLKFITSRKARVITGYGTVAADGSLLDSFKVRFFKQFRNMGNYFSKKNKYQDEDSNLIK